MIRKTAAALAAAVLLTGCGETTAGVAARIGDTTIETSTFSARVARAYANEQFAQQQPREEYQRRLLNDLVVSRLVEVAADRLGVTVTDEQVDARVEEVVASYGGRQAFEQLLPTRGFHPSDVRSVIRTELLQNAVLDKLVENERVTEEQLQAEYRRQLPQLDVARVSHILVRDPKLAARVAREARAPGADFAALAKRYSEDSESKEDGGDLGPIGNGEGRFAKEFEEAVFSARSGQVVGPIRTVTGGEARIVGYEIVKVVERTTRTFEQARLDMRRAVLREQRVQRFNTLVADLAKELGVKVNPRFGRWDAQRIGVVAADGNRLSSPAPVPGAAQQPPGGQPPVQQPPPQQQPPASAPPAQ